MKIKSVKTTKIEKQQNIRFSKQEDQYKQPIKTLKLTAKAAACVN